MKRAKPEPSGRLANVRSPRDTASVLSGPEIESLRRSHAMAPLSPSHVRELIEACAQLDAERTEIKRVLADLPESFAAVRAALNRLHQLFR